MSEYSATGRTSPAIEPELRKEQWPSHCQLVMSPAPRMFHLTDLLAKALAKLPEDLEIACAKGDPNKVSTYFHDTESSQPQETVDAIALRSVQHDQLQVLEFFGTSLRSRLA